MKILSVVALALIATQPALAQNSTGAHKHTTKKTTVESTTETSTDQPRPVDTTYHSETKTVVEPNGETKTTREVETTETPRLTQGDRRALRSFSVLLHYSPLDLIIPSKIGATVAFTNDRKQAFELSYMQASIGAPFFISNIGAITDRRVEANVRFFSERTSFNLFAGLAYFGTDIHVGSELLKSTTGVPTFNLLKSQSIGFSAGIGDRWVLPYNIVLGVDWFEWAQPLIVLQEDSSIINAIQDSGAKQTIESAFHVSEFVPRLVVLKLGAGVTF